MMKKTCRLEIPMSKEDYERIRKKSEKVGMSLSSFSRLVLLNSQIKLLEIPINKEKKLIYF